MKIKTKIVSFHTADSKPVKQEVNEWYSDTSPCSIPWSNYRVWRSHNSMSCEATLIFKFGIKLNNNVMTSEETWACTIKHYGFVIDGEWTDSTLC